MSNSPLVVHTNLSPNHNAPRNQKIDTITIHHVAGNLTIETLGNVFKPTTRQASSNYGVGTDGRIGMYVEEKNRAWTSGNATNDHRAVTIEVSNSTLSPTWQVSDKALQSTIDLCADICRRNNIPKLLWRNDKSLIGQVDKQNMTVHQWFQNTNCPGPYLMSKMGYIADEVNKILLGGDVMDEGSKVTIKATATTYTTGEVIADRYKGVQYTIQSLGTSANGRLGSALIKELVSWVRLTDLQPVVVAPPATVLKSEYDIVIAQRDKLKIECDLLKDNIVRLKAEVTYLQGQVKTVSDTLAKEKATTIAQSAEMVHLNQQLATVKDSLSTEKIVLNALNTKYNKLDAEYVQLVRVDADNVKKIHDLNSQIELNLIANLNLEKEVERLYAENQSLKQQTYIDWQDATWKQLLKQAIIKWWNE
jgi:hypothetical protein